MRMVLTFLVATLVFGSGLAAAGQSQGTAPLQLCVCVETKEPELSEAASRATQKVVRLLNELGEGLHAVAMGPLHASDDDARGMGCSDILRMRFTLRQTMGTMAGTPPPGWPRGLPLSISGVEDAHYGEAVVVTYVLADLAGDKKSVIGRRSGGAWQPNSPSTGGTWGGEETSLRLANDAALRAVREYRKKNKL